ncbi:MAG: hypothetical protein M1828_005028 [Chrysothrix sp. TS-e1954]|nr:MAG: hypothetical protein M1828_005028 [Chrysothrix sp. TS-e1954]
MIALLVIALRVTLARALPQGNPISVPDNYIMCFGPPPPADAGWPVSRPQTNYVSNQQLCPTTNLAAQTVGCECRSAYVRPICDYPPADHDLWYAQLDPSLTVGWSSFDEWCVSNCFCGGEQAADRWQSYTAANQAAARLDQVGPIMAALDTDSDDSTSIASSEDGFRDTSGIGSAEVSSGSSLSDLGSATTLSDLNTLLNATIHPCPADVKCVATSACHGTDCQCKVTGAQYEPKDGYIEYTAYCMLYVAGSFFPRLGTRSEDTPCPCNTTYVSQACCDKETDGWVWEPPELKMGELVKEAW